MENKSEIGGTTRKRKQSPTLDVDDSANHTESCPYLDTVQRSLLDFDLEPTCSVTLETGPHIYGCLVCGKFFRGRGRQTPAYTHAVEESHFVFVHLTKGTFHCLPDDYEIQDNSLADVRAALHPRFGNEQVASLDYNTELSRDLLGRRYLPGFVGLNNLHKTDCINAVVQALAHVPPLRNHFLQQSAVDFASNSSAMHKHRLAYHVTECFGELVRKIWSETRFKSHVDPHRLVQAIAAASKKKFQVGQQAEAGELVAWLLHQLHLGTGGSLNMNKKKTKHQSIVQRVFQGEVLVVTRQAVRSAQKDKGSETERPDDREGSGDEEEEEEKANDDVPTVNALQIEEVTNTNHFLQLTLDIPEKPLFRDENGGLVIPQEPLASVLKKFDGVSFCDAVSASGVTQRKKYQLLRLPNYLILHLARFKSNQYIREKNPTIVAFPVKNLDLSDYVKPTEGKSRLPTEDEVKNMSVTELKELMVKHGQSATVKGALEKNELVDLVVNFVAKRLPDLLADKYDLVANITHESPVDVGREGKHDPLQEGSYKCHVQHRGTNQWYEMQDLHVQEIMPQQIGLSESYVLIFERKSAQTISQDK